MTKPKQTKAASADQGTEIKEIQGADGLAAELDQLLQTNDGNTIGIECPDCGEEHHFIIVRDGELFVCRTMGKVSTGTDAADLIVNDDVVYAAPDDGDANPTMH